MEEYLGEVTTIRHLNLSAIELVVKLVAPGTVNFVAGQHMLLKLENQKYVLPIAFPPRENNSDLVFLVTVPSEGLLQKYFRAIKIGDKITVEGPAGEFFIQDPRRDILGIAQGVGIAPFAAIIPGLLVSGFNNKFKLLFEVNSEEDVFYFERFKTLAAKYPNFSFVPMVVRPHAHWPGEVGTASTYIEVTAEYLQNHVPYICGGAEFVKVCQEQWKKSVPQGAKPVSCTLNF